MYRPSHNYWLNFNVATLIIVLYGFIRSNIAYVLHVLCAIRLGNNLILSPLCNIIYVYRICWQYQYRTELIMAIWYMSCEVGDGLALVLRTFDHVISL